MVPSLLLTHHAVPRPIGRAAPPRAYLTTRLYLRAVSSMASLDDVDTDGLRTYMSTPALAA